MGRAGAKRRQARRAEIFAASAAFHVALFLVAFSHAAGSLVSAGDAGGGPVGPVFAVTLVRLQAPPAPQAVDGASEAQPFLMKIRANAAQGIAVPTGAERSRLAALAERLTTQERTPGAPDRRAQADRVQPQGAFVPDDTRLSEARGRKARTDLGTDGDAAGEVSTGSLWGAIEPCWRNLGFKGQVPVTIDVTVDGRGGLRGPPKVVRATNAVLSDVRLKSEANALGALAACMPRADVRVTARNYRLEFPGAP